MHLREARRRWRSRINMMARRFWRRMRRSRRTRELPWKWTRSDFSGCCSDDLQRSFERLNDRERLDGGNEIRWNVNFSDVASSAGVRSRARHFERMMLRDKINVGVRQIFVDKLGSLKAVEIRHRDVQQDYVRNERERFLYGILTIRSFPAYAPAFVHFEKQLQARANHRHIVCD
jgi:hypothetical protein